MVFYRFLRGIAAFSAGLLLNHAQVLADSGTWRADPGSGDWNAAANWKGNSTPNGINDTAIFGLSSRTTVSISGSTQLYALTFTASATTPYTITVDPNISLTINGSGIVNLSGTTQDFIVSTNGSSQAGSIVFSGTASASVLTQFTVDGGTTNDATGAALSFTGQSTAGSAILIANGGSNGGLGGAIYFTGSSSGGAAQAIVNGNGVFDISGLTDQATSIGSIAGSGTYYLGGNTLTVGGNNMSSTVTGVIADGGIASGAGGSLVKTGTGTLTLAGANTYTGATTVNAGTLAITGTINSPNSYFTVDGSPANSATAILSGTGSITSLDSWIGYNGAGSFIQTGGINNAGDAVTLGQNAGSSGSYNLTGGTLNTQIGIEIGGSGSGSFVQNGGVNNAGDGITVAFYANSSGSYLQTGGTNTSDDLMLGYGAGSDGTYTLSGGLLECGESIDVGSYQGSASFIQTDGTNIVGYMLAVLGGSNTATYSLSGGLLQTGTTEVAPDGGNVASFVQTEGTNDCTQLVVCMLGTSGTYSISGGLLSCGTIYVAETFDLSTGVGTILQSGGIVQSGTLVLAELGGNGNYNLSGGALQTQDLIVGDFGAGNFVQTGGTNTSTNVTLGYNGPAVTGTGTYSLNGGTLNTSGIAGGAGVSTFNFNGGTLQAGGSNGVFMSGLTVANVQSGGAIIDTNGYAITIPQSLLHDTTPGAPAIDGGLTKIGLGTLTLAGWNTYTGPTSVNAGTLAVTGTVASTGSVSVAPNSTLEVDGLLNLSATSIVSGTFRGNGSAGAIDVAGYGTLAPGLNSFSGSAGILTANGNITLTGSTSIFSIRLGVAAPGDYDQLTMAMGNVALNGATLDLMLGQNYVSPSIGSIYVIVNGEPADSIITGTFAQGDSITASDGDIFSIVYGENATDTGPGSDVLLVLPAPEPGTWALLIFGSLIISLLLHPRKHPQRE